jgi:hypothetical protein
MRAFVRKHQEEPLGWIGITLRYAIWVRSFKFIRINPEYQEDYEVHRALSRAFQEISKKENKGKVLVFDSLREYRVVPLDQLSKIDVTNCLRQVARLKAFFYVHTLQGKLSFSFIPFLELTDDLDDIVERFRKGEDYTTLREPMERLLRRIARRRVQAVISAGSAVIALFLSIFWLLGSEEQASKFRFFVSQYGLVGLAFSFLLTYYIVWRSFPPLLQRTSRASAN